MGCVRTSGRGLRDFVSFSPGSPSPAGAFLFYTFHYCLKVLCPGIGFLGWSLSFGIHELIATFIIYHMLKKYIPYSQFLEMWPYVRTPLTSASQRKWVNFRNHIYPSLRRTNSHSTNGLPNSPNKYHGGLKFKGPIPFTFT